MHRGRNRGSDHANVTASGPQAREDAGTEERRAAIGEPGAGAAGPAVEVRHDPARAARTAAPSAPSPGDPTLIVVPTDATSNTWFTVSSAAAAMPERSVLVVRSCELASLSATLKLLLDMEAAAAVHIERDVVCDENAMKALLCSTATREAQVRSIPVMRFGDGCDGRLFRATASGAVTEEQAQALCCRTPPMELLSVPETSSWAACRHPPADIVWVARSAVMDARKRLAPATRPGEHWIDVLARRTGQPVGEAQNRGLLAQLERVLRYVPEVHLDALARTGGSEYVCPTLRTFHAVLGGL